ncbi:uncharacterized protein LOC142542175 isoform X2 [Primulina tabacum]|uniref:uncharacterized protein LOC142542175 isoform X2 n=1 Tax=Primulina tabacum TaxID=48773 RepID=UPI003F59E8CA
MSCAVLFAEVTLTYLFICGLFYSTWKFFLFYGLQRRESAISETTAKKLKIEHTYKDPRICFRVLHAIPSHEAIDTVEGFAIKNKSCLCVMERYWVSSISSEMPGYVAMT